MTVSLTRVGNSRAVIIPAKILKQLNITDNSTLEMMLDEKSGVVSLKKSGVRQNIVFPAVDIPEPSNEHLQEFMSSLYIVPEDDVVSDDRLAYILGK